MKNFVLVLVLIFGLTSLIGCNKKKKDEDNSDLNGVTTENVVSVTDNAAPPADNSVPVVVENSAATANADVGEPAMAPAPAESAEPSGKPTPKEIQQALKNAGLYDGNVDGKIGPKTKKAVEAFQSQNSLKADGKVGRKTWKLLSPYLNKPAEVANPSADSQAVTQ